MTVLQSQPSPRPRSATDLFGDPVDGHPPWLNPTAFLSSDFDSDSYISDLRTFVPFETLRPELQSHLSSLKRQLVDLINRDYADFVSLSTKLVDVDASVVRMRAPLLDLKEKILVFRASVESSLLALKSLLKQTADANEARELLEVLLDTFHVVSKVEKLIKELPSVPVDWSDGQVNSAENLHLSNGTTFQHGETGPNVRETQSMLLERIASEMNRLKFFTVHAKNMPFIQNMEKRIQNANSLLETSLGHCFVDALEHRDASAIYNCLRAYAAIGNTRSAEEIFRAEIVAPVIQKVIPNSPSGVVDESSGDELEEDYKRIKQSIEDNCKFLLEISSRENSGLHVFDFLANSILKEVLSAIQKGKPGAFSWGRPEDFLKNYTSSLDFLTHLEGYCTSRSEVSRFRGEGVYAEFMKQWNVGVYFQLRFKKIAGKLDSALTVASLAPVESAFTDEGEPHSLILPQSVSLLQCLRSCWRDDIFVVSCSDKFLRLTLQLLSRYSNWLSTGLATRKSRNVGTNAGCEWAISATLDDLVHIIHDLDSLVVEVTTNYLGRVVEILKSCPRETLDLVKGGILQGGNSLKDALSLAINSIVDTLVEKCVEVLSQLTGISQTYRVSNKPLPVKPLHYVSGILQPLKDFLDGEQATKYLKIEIRSQLVQQAAFEITRRYTELVVDLVTRARETESSLQNFRRQAQRRAGPSPDVSDNTVSIADKLCMQLFLDIQEFGRNLSSLGVNPSDIPAYHSLFQCVAPADKQNTISF